MDTGCSTSEDVKFARLRRRRAWINYRIFELSSDEESDMKPFKLKQSSKPPLPKGVIRGCSNCNNCQKVLARWDPQNAHRQDINEAPVFYPNKEEFKDPLKYIASIRQMVEPYGICRIVPPPSWKPSCLIKQKHIWENAKFATRIQQLDKLQNRKPMKKRSRSIAHIKKRRKKCLKIGLSCSPSDAGNKDIDECFNEDESFGFLPGPEFTLESFQKYADDFLGQYFDMKDMIPLSSSSQDEVKHRQEPAMEDIEGEYWRMVENPTEEIEVLYGADVETGAFVSGFPKASSDSGDNVSDVYVRSGWNLNNLPRLAGSLLSFEKTDISGVLVPWLYIGMCFSSFCWHVEDHHLYSLNYMHLGAPKLWYSVPGSHALKLEAAMKKHLPDLFEEQPDLLHKLVTQFSPMILKLEGVPVYRCVQQSGEFVLTFPRAYHSGFNCGFNCAEAVNVAPIDWLPHGQSAVELYCQQPRKTSLSHDKLLLGAAQEAVRALWELHLLRKDTPNNLRWPAFCGKDGILTLALKTRVDIEHARRKFFCNPSQVRKMDISFDATNERECVICFYDLHLSAVGCDCCPEIFACLNHAKQLCSCDWSTRFFLFRYELNELDLCIEALEGKLSAIHRWENLDRGLSLSSCATVEDFHGSERKCVLFRNPSLDENKLEKRMPVDDVSIRVAADVSVSQLETNKPLEQPVFLGKTKIIDHRTQSRVDFTSATASHLPDCPEINAPEPDLASKSQAVASEQGRGKFSGMNELGNFVSEDGLVIVGSEVHGLKGHFKSRNQNLHGSNEPSVSKPTVESLSVCQFPSTDMYHENSPIQLEQGTFSTAADNVRLRNLEREKTGPGTSHGSNICLSDNDGHCDQVTSGCKSLITTNLANSGSGGSGILHLLSDPYKIPSNLLNEEVVLADSSSTKYGSCMQFIFSSARSCTVPNLSGNCQRGPRIAKVVRRLNCDVEPLDFGLVVSGEAWCNKQTIFPKGFRSRVRYFSVLDPTQMSCYISEIFDAGLSIPLFRVIMEDYPTEVFMHVSAINCWDMVREKVNQTIVSQYSQGKLNLPPLQPPRSVDGFDMFGFSSPFIVQKIESLDPSHLCVEYWNCERSNKKSVKALAESSTEVDQSNTKVAAAVRQNKTVECILKGLFKRAERVELIALHEALNHESMRLDKTAVIKFLEEEMQDPQHGKFDDMQLVHLTTYECSDLK